MDKKYTVEILIEKKFFHKIDKLVNYKKDVFEDFVDYINEYIDEDMSSLLFEMIEELYYQKKYLGKRIVISKDAIRLAKKINEVLGRWNIFPRIEKVAGRGWDTGGGTWSWAMDDVTGVCLGSCSPVRFCLKKKVKLLMSDNNEIIAGY